MEGTGILGTSQLLLVGLSLFVSGLQAEVEEEQKCLVPGKTLTVFCPYNIVKYSSSLKAWQRLRSQGPPETLVLTDTTHEDVNRARAGRYLLEDYPSDAILKVTVTGLGMQDIGLYQCVIHHSPENLVVLYHRIRLVQCAEQQGDPDGQDLLQSSDGVGPHVPQDLPEEAASSEKQGKF